MKFEYMIMDELYTFIGKKRKKYYLWTSIAVTSTKKYFYFYHLSKYKDAGALFTFNENLPKVNKVYTDGCFSYDRIYGDKAHAKSFKWLDERLAVLFVDKNLSL